MEDISKGTITVELTKEQQDLLNLGDMIQSGETKWYFFPYWVEVGAEETKFHSLENLPQELKMLIEKNREFVEKIFGSEKSDSNLGEIDEGVG